MVAGIDFAEKIKSLGKDLKVGLITNQTGVDSKLISDIEIFKTIFGSNFICVFGPEHGVFGSEQAGNSVPSYYDEHFKINIVSLYNDHQEEGDIDKRMRTSDVSYKGKSMQDQYLESIDILFFDIQDVGTRVYTYIATMINAMATCKKLGKKFVILDRPNPISSKMEGPLMEDEYISYIGSINIPLRHGMTVGEIGKYYNTYYLESKLDLEIVKMDKYGHGFYEESKIPWVMPSPNIPTVETALVYPGQVLLEGTNISEGRGTTRPFEIFGSPWIDGYDICRELNNLSLPGVRFRQVKFIPYFSKYSGQLCNGAQIHIMERYSYDAYTVSINIISILHNKYPDNFEFHSKYFDKVNGTAKIRKLINDGDTDSLFKENAVQLDTFKDKYRAISLY